jgi:MFS family permease
VRQALQLLKDDRRARFFFFALAQSAVGTGAGYVALLLLAYERFDSPWAVGLTLFADLLPAMLLGPLFGAAADRWSKRTCLIIADVTRAFAFVGIAFVPSIEATLVLAMVAGTGTGLFTPAGLSALPNLVGEKRLPAATAVYGAVADLGFTIGPAVAAGLLLLIDPAAVTVINGGSFAISAVVLALLRFGVGPQTAPDEHQVSLVREAWRGLSTVAAMPAVRVILLASSAALFCGGLFNVAELPFATRELDLTDAGFSILVALFGLGFVVGSLSGASGGDLPQLKQRYLLGLLLMALTLVGLASAQIAVLAGIAFTAAGIGNGMLLVYERLIIQATTPEPLLGRVFGIKDALTAWAFAAAFLSAGAVIDLAGIRPMLFIAGGLGLAIWLGATAALRLTARADLPGTRAGVRRYGRLGKKRSHFIRGRDSRLKVLQDVDERVDDAGIELGSGTRE